MLMLENIETAEVKGSRTKVTICPGHRARIVVAGSCFWHRDAGRLLCFRARAYRCRVALDFIGFGVMGSDFQRMHQSRAVL